MTPEEELQAVRQEYLDLGHAMQSGVAMMMNYGSTAHEPKHLRVGINSAMCDVGGLAGLLIKKGIITELEYYKAMRDAMQDEVGRYRMEIAQHLGVDPESIQLR